jgi:flagella basal body P-ring formation protein FlgA
MTNTIQFLGKHLKRPLSLSFAVSALFGVVFPSSHSHAQHADWQTLEQLYIHPQLQNLPTGSQVNIRVQNHPKLNSNQCPLALFKLTPGQKLWGKAIAQVQCPGHGNALFFVQLTVDVMAPVLIASRSLSKGSAIGNEDTTLELRNIAELKSAYFHTPKQLEQKKTTQYLPAGAVIESRHVEGPTMVKQGDKVRVKLTGQGFDVESHAIALENGGLGDAVRVRTPQGRVLRGKAIEFMVVELLL